MSVRDTIFLIVFIGDPILFACLDVYYLRRGRARSMVWSSLLVCVASTLIWFGLYRGSDFGTSEFDLHLLHEHIWAPPFYFGVPAVVVGFVAAHVKKSWSRVAQVCAASLIGILSLVPAYVFGLGAALTASGYRGF